MEKGRLSNRLSLPWFEILRLPSFYVVRQLVRQLVYQVCYTRYQFSLYLWCTGSLLKHFKVPKYYEQDCRCYPNYSKTSITQQHCVKSVQIRSFFISLVFSGPYFSVFVLNTEIYSVYLRKSPYSIWIQGNTYQKKLRIWTFFTQCKCRTLS